ncbi:DUF1963 domain-containing protein [Lysinibacillus telephonicus]|uniref:DUF1963 domain-containing protein n=1 Tax=Lysinibacillus telephonicus TaxID=1714840 RepID=A0A431UUY7_9BACI|nr:DUF1963 domain-containing protein [Lysinibacillus telephonicus]
MFPFGQYVKLVGGITLEFERFFELPHQLECFRNKLEPSLLNTSLIIPYHRITSLSESKFAGNPYLPKMQNYPKDPDGDYMYLLAQINFAKAPLMFPFPSQGIMQIFVSKSVCYFENQVQEFLFQQYFKIRYYATVLPEDQLTTDFTFLKSSSNEVFPIIQNEMALTFTNRVEPVSATDYRVEKYLPLSSFGVISEDERTLEDIYFEKYLAAEHKIGGYPYFINSDKRKDSSFLRKYDTLLLQIVSNDEQGIMYGDTGILKFFISKEDLINLNFSNIYFHGEQY